MVAGNVQFLYVRARPRRGRGFGRAVVGILLVRSARGGRGAAQEGEDGVATRREADGVVLAPVSFCRSRTQGFTAQKKIKRVPGEVRVDGRRR